MSHPQEDSKSALLMKFGEYFYKLSRDKSDDETLAIFCNFFNQSAQSQNQQHRLICAHNLPVCTEISIYRICNNEIYPGRDKDSWT
jgi:hypothetical protein